MPDIRLVVAIVVVLMSALAGWTTRGWKEDAARLDAEREAHARYIKIAEAYGTALNEANAGRAQDQQQAASDRQDFTRRLKDETRKGTRLVGCGAGLDAGRLDHSRAAVRFDPAFVGLWDDGLAVGLPEAYRAARPDRSGAGADLLEPEDLLANVAENGEQCNDLRSRLLTVKRWWAGVEAAGGG
jgi:type II secretory pathway pseudopilin PulG